MAQRFYAPIPREFTNAGAIGVGFKWYFYTTGTTTPITTYSNVGLSSSNTNPVVADENGRFAEIFVSDFSLVKAVLKDASGNTISTVDPVNPSGSSSVTLNDLGVRPMSYWGVTAGTTSAYTLVANPTITAYSNNQTFIFQANAANAAAPTMAIDGLTALNLKKYTGQGTKVALQAGDLQATERYEAINDGVDIVVLNPRNKNTYLGTGAALTIATGVVTITNGGSLYALDTEGAAATDDLDTINGGNQGQVIIIGNTADARDVVLQHNTGNIYNPGGIDITLGVTSDRVTLMYDSTLAKWIVIGVNAAGSTPMQLLDAKTASASASLQFTSGLNSTYSKYRFDIENILPANSGVMLTVQYSIDGGSTWINANYLQTNTFQSSTDGIGSSTNKTTGLSLTGNDANSQTCSNNVSTKGINGEFILFNPSSAVHKQANWKVNYTTHTNNYQALSMGTGIYTGSASAVTAIQFIFKTVNTDTNNGNITSGTIKMYGVI